jgi:hypothetical protein
MGRVKDEIGPRKVLAFEQQRLAEHLGQSVRMAISKVETRPMPALAEPAEGVSGEPSLFGVDRDEFYTGTVDEKIQLTRSQPVLVVAQDLVGVPGVPRRAARSRDS